MKNDELIISNVVGYILKLMKNNVNINSHMKEFAANHLWLYKLK